MESKLVYGRIPKGTECPFKDECGLLPDCVHQGLKHQIDFSCGAARAFDISKRSNEHDPRTN